MEKARVAKKYGTDCFWLLKAANVGKSAAVPQIIIVFCPKSKGPIPDDDNRIAAFKAGRDALAKVLGIDDRHFKPTYMLGDRSKDGWIILELRGVVS